MRTSIQIQQYVYYYEIAKKLNFWSTFIRFLAGITIVSVVSIFITLFYNRSIDFTFQSAYNLRMFMESKTLYVCILILQIFKLLAILTYNAFACVTGFKKTLELANRNLKFGKIIIIIYAILELADILLCLLMYSNISEDGFIEVRALILFLSSVLPTLAINSGYWVIVCLVNKKYLHISEGMRLIRFTQANYSVN